jgi:uncharacterized membrane protein
MTSEETVTPDRMNAFSDGVFAVIITILVLELRPPKEASFGALLELWPTTISYAIRLATSSSRSFGSIIITFCVFPTSQRIG